MEVLQWTDKQNEVDTVDAHDINNIANNLIETQNQVNKMDEQTGNIELALESFDERLEQKNDKTHWIEKVPNERTFLEENTFTATLNSSGLGLYKWTDSVNHPYKLLPNSKYTIVFDDVAYEYEISETVPTNIGNMQLGDETVEGEPFRCTFNKNGMYINIFVLDEEPHKISIIETTYTDVYHKIDKNFLPMAEITTAVTESPEIKELLEQNAGSPSENFETRISALETLVNELLTQKEELTVTMVEEGGTIKKYMVYAREVVE